MVTRVTVYDGETGKQVGSLDVPAVALIRVEAGTTAPPASEIAQPA